MLVYNVYAAEHFWVWAAAIRVVPRLIELPLVAIVGEKIIFRFLFAQGFKPNIMVLTFFLIFPTYRLPNFNRNLSRDELEVLDDHKYFLVACHA